MARYKKINQKQFEALCSIQCTKEEICSVLGVSEKTLNSWCKEIYEENFSLVFEQKRNGGKASLRRTQWKIAETNPTMAIFLGKQYLGQADQAKIQSENINTNINPMEGLTTDELKKLIKD